MSDAGFIFELILLARYDQRIHCPKTSATIQAY